MASTVIRVSAVVIRDDDGRVLTVRKVGTSRFMLPGGKHEPGERPVMTAVREVDEELGVTISVDDLRFLGVFTTDAANEPGHVLISHVYLHDPVGLATPGGEIEEIRRLDIGPGKPLPGDLAPLLTDAIVPLLREEDATRPTSARPIRGTGPDGNAPRRGSRG